jgi:MoaA/NifB/PqqE/SkfB family radical SAM enzyme
MLHYLNPFRNLGKVLISDIIRKGWHQYFPAKPTTINLLANDICNSRCKMCLIWKQKQDKELTPQDLEKILRDPLFSNVQHVGVTGGEPTLRKDLPLLFETICKSLPNLKGASSITNAINQDQVIERITVSAKVCRNYGINFSFMVSLDGVESVHDRNRGRDGNFISAINVIRHFRDKTDISLSVGCTITKENVWGVDELLEFCQREKIYVRFRVAEFINRLYNLNETHVIRNFTEAESYHLALFFKKLELIYEKSENVKRTYHSIQKMLLGESRRTIGCPYQSQAMLLSSKGEMQYCAPKSKVIGNVFSESAADIWKKNLSERRRILRENCKDCIHDYHASITFPELISDYEGVLWRRLFRLDRTMQVSSLIVEENTEY